MTYKRYRTPKASPQFFTLHFSFFIIFLTCFQASAFADTSFARAKERPIVVQPPVKEVPAGEKLAFLVRWFGIPVGEGLLQIEKAKEQGVEGYLITAESRANDFLSKFYLLEDKMTSFVRADDLSVLWAEKNLKEGRYRCHEKVVFRPGEKKAFYESFTNGTKKEIELSGAAHDILGAFFWMRLQNVKPGESATTTVNADEKNWEFKVRALRTEKLEMKGLGNFDSIVMEPIASFKGVFIDRGRAWIYLTTDPRRIPVKIRLETKFGPIIGILEQIP